MQCIACGSDGEGKQHSPRCGRHCCDKPEYSSPPNDRFSHLVQGHIGSRHAISQDAANIDDASAISHDLCGMLGGCEDRPRICNSRHKKALGA